MSNCPKCSHELKGDFGLVECESCGHAIMMGMDGEILDQSELVQEVVPEINMDSAEPPIYSSDSTYAGLDEVNQSEELEQIQEGEYVDEFTSFDISAESIEPEEEIEKSKISEITTLQDVNSDDDFNQVIEEFNDEKTNFLAKKTITESRITQPEPELVNLSEFANTSSSQVDEGVLKYNIFFSGIDSHDLKEVVFEELSDKKLLLDVSVLKKEMKNGALTIKSISAVKASIIINRLSHLPISILWDQYDIRKA